MDSRGVFSAFVLRLLIIAVFQTGIPALSTLTDTHACTESLTMGQVTPHTFLAFSLKMIPLVLTENGKQHMQPYWRRGFTRAIEPKHKFYG